MKLFLITCVLAVVFANKVYSAPASDVEEDASLPSVAEGEDEGAANAFSGVEESLPKGGLLESILSALGIIEIRNEVASALPVEDTPAIPVDDSATPTDASAIPADASAIPADASAVPAVDVPAVPAEDIPAVPADDSAIPADASASAADTSAVPADASAIPANASAVPAVDAPAVPTEDIPAAPASS